MIDIKNYNKENVFAKILRNEISSSKVYEDEDVLAFKDLNPQAPIHFLVIPKLSFCSFDDFASKAEDKLICSMIRSINKIVKKFNIEDGYRVITNIGTHGGQEVPHFHFHLLAGKPLGRLLSN